MSPTQRTDRIFRPAEAAMKLGISRSTLYALVARGLIEKPQPISFRAVGWKESQLDSWLEARAKSQPASSA